MAIVSATATTPLPAQPRALFEIVDVDRDAVPAGTPAAFETVFAAPSIRTDAIRRIDGETFTFVPLALIPISPTRVALVSTAANECTAPQCAGRTSVHYLDHDEGRPSYPYQAAGEWLDAGVKTTAGRPVARWGHTDAITAVPVLYTEAPTRAPGSACTMAVLTELAPAGPVEIARFPVRRGDGGSAALAGRIVAAEKGRSFTLAYTGAQAFDETYVRGDGGRYRPVAASRVSGC
ncbi:hypothetical protein QLH51_03645 [Sphingomonas sp. 2R-10]|uniref:hypothetical protein n=1 Tax=Sphingomonas sp. 2R-10 TaxID=3045148 RepID=UPI0019D2F85A|nr:hypothetical protein [Sphingomonas sp. 2R-10]MDJ0275895.1 hypothetical protein [Sphingomonas sp. 2R-10]